MSSGNTTGLAIDSICRPLCSRYHLVILEALSIQVMEDGVAGTRTLCWVLGILADGQYETLGVWADSLSSSSLWQDLWKSLKVRGVERIRFVSGSESATLLAALNQTFSCATVMPAGRQLETPRVIADPVRAMQRRATRAIKRHGCFSSLADATSFVWNALTRAEHSLEVEGVGPNAVPMRFLASGARREGFTTAVLSH